MADKIYVGGAKLKTFCEGTEREFTKMNVSICLTDLPPEHISTSQSNGKKYIDLTIAERREEGRFGDTHYVCVDTWRVDKIEKDLGETTAPKGDNLPF